jgi:6-pyruvoyltetrahydropterin/6-carboxytetrahydropterin synthase
MPATITVRVSFEAAHRLHNPERGEEWNRSTFGKCNNRFGHGHNYVLEVAVEGEVEEETGFLVDMKALKELLHRLIVDEVDHRHLNHEVPWLAGVNPTAENLARAFYRRIVPALPPSVRLQAVTVHETERNSATWRE